jgi:hypothetical protein
VRTSRDWTKVARNTAKVALVIRLRTKIRTTRGLNCPAAICTATSEMLKTTPMKVIMAALIVVTTVFASSAIPSRSLTASSSPASRSAVRIASSAAVAADHTTNTRNRAAVGANQNVSRRCSRTATERGAAAVSAAARP